MNMRKIFAGVAAAATLLGGLALGAATANAAEPTADANGVVTSEATFTFTAASADQLTNRTIKAYKIGDYVKYGTGNDVTYGVQSNATNKAVVKTALEKALNQQNLSDDALTNALTAGNLDQSGTRPWQENGASTESTTRKFAEALSADANKLIAVTPDVSLGTPTRVTGATDDNTYTSTVKLPAGIYLFVDETAATDSITKAVPMIVGSGTVDEQTKTLTVTDTDVATVNFKNTKNADKTKEAGKKNASIGDYILYTLKGKLADPAPASFSFVDTPSKGLTVIKDDTDVAHPFKVQSSDDDKTYTDVPTGDFTLDLSQLTENKGDGVKTFTVTINEDKLATYAGKYIKVTYYAQVNDEAEGETGVTNKLVKNDGTTTQTETKLYGFNFTKTDAAGNPIAFNNAQGAKNVEFQIKSGTTVLKFIKNTNGTYYKAANQNDTNATDTLYTNEQGKIALGGLAAGTYTVEETQVADDYMDVKASFTVTIAENDGAVTFVGTDAWGLAPKESSTDYKVKNVKSITQLPLTGAAGTALFTVLGLLLAGAAATVYTKSRSTNRALRA